MKTTIEPFKINPGVYRLDHDVTNPQPDRRSRDWDKRPTWKAGTIYIVHGEPEIEIDVPDDLSDEDKAKLRGKMIRSRYQRIECVSERHVDYIQPWRDPVRWNALTSALVPCAETWEAFWRRLDQHGGDDFMRWLVYRGFITREQIEAEFNAWSNEDEASKWREVSK